MTINAPRPVLLCVLDGFGYREGADDNAVAQANTPVWDGVLQKHAHTLLDASGLSVGLPEGQMGNSEVGHMNIGAGRVVFQDLPKINRAIESGDFPTNKQLQSFIKKMSDSKGTCHLMGLVSSGGVHAHQDHCVALAKALDKAGIPVCIHAFLDGRDVPPQSAVGYVEKLLKDIKPLKHVKLSTLCGRYYAMDRDKRWERVQRAYDMLVHGAGTTAKNPLKAIKDSYQTGVSDEFVEPVILDGFEGMADGDGLLFFNFRADRARELMASLLDPVFDGFKREKKLTLVQAVGMTPYSKELSKYMGFLFPHESIENTLGEVIAKSGKTQLRIAETEKYPHVTFFFNGGEEAPYKREERILVPSPKVATYDLQPEMSAPEVTDKVVAAIESEKFDLIVLNFANPDMVGHTGNLQAAVKAVETVDASLGRILAFIERAGGVALITADHGNCECMYDSETQGPHTAHTLSKVPFVYVSGDDNKKLRKGRLADIAPTILEILGLEKPTQMDGESLFV